jgi:superfamily II DNA or RNA helicase
MDGRQGYYELGRGGFRLFTSLGAPAWRMPQIGALGAVMAHWSLPRGTPALVSIPTGTGKTAIAVAAPYLARAQRVLVVVPSTELRRQMTSAFRDQEVLRRIGAVDMSTDPVVTPVAGRVDAWASLEASDVVVALPNSISPEHYTGNLPGADLFDLLVIDEAHHAPARTWRALLEHFSSARALLLTATPRRRDGQRVPGDHVYHYPLRQAVIDGIFKPVVSRVLSLPTSYTRDTLDDLIIADVVGMSQEAAHATSTILVRASTRDRAGSLASKYRAAGIDIEVLHSALAERSQQQLVDRLRSGELRAVAVIGMLIEGFDLPSLRIVAYHDKHKSLPATAQLIGRLARVDDRFPQPSVLVTVRDVDVFPELQGAVRALYEEDSDWATVLPGVIDDEIAEDTANREYARLYTAPPPEVSLEAVQPVRRAILYEISPNAAWRPAFLGGTIPPELHAGSLLRGRTVLYAGLNSSADTLMVITTVIARPTWHNDAGLDTPAYDLHLVSYRPSPRATLPSLLLFNTAERWFVREMLGILGGEANARPADPSRLQEAFDSVDRVSVSSVGVRNTYGGGRGVPSYRIFAGSGVDRGLRDTDTRFGALGHAMVQVADGAGAYTAGVATSKGKYWETRDVPLRGYEQFLTGLAERYWFPAASVAGQLLPQVARGRRLTAWPAVDPLAVELDFALLGTGWDIPPYGALDSLDLRALPPDPATVDRLRLELIAAHDPAQPVVWRGYQDLIGNVTATSAELSAHRGFGGSVPLAELLTERPPTIFFTDGTTVHGSAIVDSRTRGRALPPGLLSPHGWEGVDITAETPARAAVHGKGRCVQDALLDYLRSRPHRARHRWIVYNDGPGEIADYLVIETGRYATYLGLWHAKFSGGAMPSVRVTDLQEVITQAIKSRRWITDTRIWEELGARIAGRASPAASVVDGNGELLRVLCGESERWADLSLRRRPPIVSGHIAIAQPGLSISGLESDLAKAAPSQSAIQSQDLLTVLHDSVSLVAPTVTVLCSA